MLAGLLAAMVLPATAAADPPFPASCPPVPSPNGDRICTAQVPSFDGTSLDVDVTQPAQGTGSSHPLIVLLHGFGNDKHEWESTSDEGDGADKREWNSHWFARHGYYVLTYTARGFRTSPPSESYQPPTPSGTSADPAKGRIHLKSRETEIRDTQWVAALAAKSFPDIDPSKVAVSGGSYGGGESWTQASQSRWTFPHDTDATLPILDLQVAVPKYPWTDLGYSLAPNGHPGTGQRPAGYCDVDQSLAEDPCYSSAQGDPEDDSGAGNPIGVDKLSYTNIFYSYGSGASGGQGFQLEDTCDTPQAASVDAWYQRIVVAGEPYSDSDPTMQQIRHGLTECRGSYYQDEGWKAQASGPRRVAIFSIQGWTDDLFGPVESFRQFKYLKKLNPRWPVSVALADVGHPRAKNNPATWHFLNQQAWQWLQSHIGGSHDQDTTVSGQQTVCDNGGGKEDPNDPKQNLTASSPERLSSGKLSITYTGGGTTTSESPDPNGPPTDPVANSAVGAIVPRPGNCPTSAGPAPYTGISQELKADRTYVGLGSVTVPYQLLAGTTAQLDTRVWDIPPGSAANAAGSADCQKRPTPKGCPLLITRGAYRLDTPAYDATSGQLRIPLAGNQFRLPKGHRIRVDLTQLDAPYLRKSNVPSTIKFTSPTLTLPTRDSGTTTVKGAGASTGP